MSASELDTGLRRLLAPNPGPMTHRGTNTYLLGDDPVTIVDPGPAIATHLDAILSAIRGSRVEAIVVTHAHLDHSELAPLLRRRTGAPIVAYGPPEAGRSPVMAGMVEGDLGGGEGVDHGFDPDITCAEGDRVGGGIVRHLPGHFGGQVGLDLGDAILTGDHVMGWSTTLISPPDGDLTAFIATSRRLIAMRPRICHPGHGDPVDAPCERLGELIRHREARDAQIMAALSGGPATPPELARRVYVGLDPTLRPAATRNVLAHLVAAWVAGRVTADRAPSPTALFALA